MALALAFAGMGFFFLASISGLFPGLALPFGLGWKEIHPFDLAFAACIAFAAAKGALRSPDWRLLAAGAALAASSAFALWVHPSPAGGRVVMGLIYSLAVLLVISHLRLDLLEVRLDRTIVWPLFAAVGLATLIFVAENLFDIDIGRNRAMSLPAGVHRFGGLTGANTLVLFLCLAAPLVRKPALIGLGILLPAFATLSRSVLGVGIALIASRSHLKARRAPARRLLAGTSWFAVAVGLAAYGLALVPVKVAERTPFHVGLEPGAYLTLHLAALRMFWSNPIAGVGPDQSFERYREFTSEEERERVLEVDAYGWMPHSALLGLAAEQGLPSLAAFVWLLWEIYGRLGRAQDGTLRRASLAGLTGLLVGGHFVDWLALKGLWFWIGLLVAASSEGASPDGGPRAE